jgi:hypothetical protein
MKKLGATSYCRKPESIKQSRFLIPIEEILGIEESVLTVCHVLFIGELYQLSSDRLPGLAFL